MSPWPQQISILIPCFNEAQRILPTVAAVQDWCRAQLQAHEVLVIDDGSSDATAAVVEGLNAPDVRLIRIAQNRGKGHALRLGAEAARLPWVLFLDADHAIPIEQLARFLPHTDKCPVLIGSKRHREAQVERARRRGLAGRLGQWLIALLAVPGIRDTQCGFKLLRTSVAQELLAKQRIERFGFDFELLFLARRYGYQILELPVQCRDAGDGSVSIGSYLRTLMELFRLVGHRLLGRYPKPA